MAPGDGQDAPSLQIRDETPADVVPIHAVTTRAFTGATHASGTEAEIVALLRAHAQLAVSLVAEADGEVRGHVALSRVALSDGTTGWFGLGPVSVDPGHQRMGIGSRLIEAAMARLQQAGAAGCVVLGDPAYYGRFGFSADPRLVLADVPPMYFQCLALRGPVPSATVRYDQAFDAAG